LGRDRLDEVAEEALDLEGDYEMKVFCKGFVNGVKNCTVICAVITGAMGAMYGLVKGLEYLINTHGEVVVAVCSVVALIILFGIFEGFWARYQYNKWAKRLEWIESQKSAMIYCDYEYEINKAKKAMEAILNHDYSMIVR
jgi:hypothetical protein